MAKNCCRYFTVSLVPVAALVLTILFAGGVLILPILYSELVKQYVYGVVIDAGSTHTTLYVYRWQVPTSTFTHSHTGTVQQMYSCPLTHNNSTSVNSYAGDPSRVAEAYQACINTSYGEWYQSKIVPIEQRKYTRIYLGATAGMRLVELDNSTVSNTLISNIQANLKNPNLTQYKYGNASILTGSEEAETGWIAANYLRNNLTAFKTRYSSIGALDLGGASTQIAFETNETVPSQFFKNESLFGVNYNLYARSYLCYGENQAYSRFLAHLINVNRNITVNVPNPCLFNGTKIPAINSSAIYTTCVNHTVGAQVFGHKLTPPPSLRDTVSFVGTGNTTQCKQYINDTFNNFCNYQNCDGFVVPPVSGHFVGFSGLYYTADFFNTTNITFTSSSGWGHLTNNVDTFCNLSSDQATPFAKDQFFYMRCFSGYFMSFLLVEGFGFTEDRSWSVEFKLKLDGVEESPTLGWSLGYIMEKSNKLPQDPYSEVRPYTTVDLVVGMIILSILCAIFIVFFFLTFYACKKALNTRSGYQNI
ncbi:ectonucleoside triphosphate diphosphohydrolase 8-like [Halichondria panicea]|uniref:ectonucleoside triphosphate diphosphohydrolase 8-like n=1 Tax=Halichondria panicea TaxID=6063 RepID=UPI00312B8D35